MGIFDYVTVNDPAYQCSEGHSLCGESFQTKDLGCTAGHAEIGGIGSKIALDDGGYGEAPTPGLTGEIQIYTDCHACPAFVQATTGNIVTVWCEFRLRIANDVVQGIERISRPTAEFLRDEPKREYLAGCFGPMPYEQAKVKRSEVWQERRWERKQ